MPKASRMRRSQDALSKVHVDNKGDNDTHSNKDLGSNGDRDVLRAGSPHDAHDTGDNTHAAEAEHHARNDELAVSAHVKLEDSHM